ncbi:MAG TPA: pyridoxal-phosphate dependent enzyme [Candidatus Limnocylindrales bacterium]|nr:pyridoxal-phosphate dependent enzyme [Candidatus Limnocylindrales bacterium]
MKLTHRCNQCQKTFPHAYTPKCTYCGGLVDIYYDLSRVKIYDSPHSLEKYFDLLPIQDSQNLLPLGEGNTPCVHAKALGEALGLKQVFLKVESRNPTGTTKDRMAAVVLSFFKELQITEFVSSSTGNSSNALAYGILKYPYFKMHLFIGGEFQERVRFSDFNPGVLLHVLTGRTFAEAFNQAREYAFHHHLPFEAGFFNPARREGLKLAFLEAVDQVPVEIRWYFQAVSSAMGVYGTYKGAKEFQTLGRIRYIPRMVCVQQEGCCPMVKAFEEGSPVIREHHIVKNPKGIAKAILRGNPVTSYPYIYRLVQETKGTFISVTETEIKEAKALLFQLEKIDCGYTAATTVAALRKLADQRAIPPEEGVLLNLTD